MRRALQRVAWRCVLGAGRNRASYCAEILRARILTLRVNDAWPPGFTLEPHRRPLEYLLQGVSAYQVRLQI
jgi:hypothetical protein